MGTHTPGPWMVEGDGPHHRLVIRAGMTPLAEMWLTGQPLTERHANARVMATAPELLTAAIEAMAAMDDIWDTKYADDEFIYDEMGSSLSAGYFSLRAAIAKATGATTP